MMITSTEENIAMNQETINSDSLITQFYNAKNQAKPILRPSSALTFRNINIRAGRKILLQGICGHVLPGEIIAIMGPSGSGKTTLLNVLSRRFEMLGIKKKNIQGEIYIGDNLMNKKDKRRIGYVMQDDIFFENLTLRETLMFYANVRLPRKMSKLQKEERCYEITKILYLTDCLDTMMGGRLIRGLSGGERKRANIVMELITDPEILFLDEPTSSLDSSMAMSLVAGLKNLSQSTNKTIIASIHQPNSQIFHSFNKLLLLAKGNTAYYGSIQEVNDYFSSIGFPCPQNWNTADHIIDIVGSGSLHVDDVIKIYNEKNFTGERISRTISVESTQQPVRRSKINPENSPYPFVQLKALLLRCLLQFARERWTIKYFIQFSIMGLIFGIVFQNTKITYNNVENFFGLLSYISVQNAVDPFYGSLSSFDREMVLLRKERMSGAYPFLLYYISKVFSEIIILMFRPTIAFTIAYWMAGLSSSAWYLAFMGILYYSALLVQSASMVIGSFGLEYQQAMSLGTIYFIFMVLLTGFYNKNIPSWIRPARYASPVYYCYVLLIWTQLLAHGGLKCERDSQLSNLAEAYGLKICSENETMAHPDDVIKLVMTDIHPGYYVILMLVLLLTYHTISFLNLRRTINKPMNEISLERKILNFFKNLTNKKKKDQSTEEINCNNIPLCVAS